MDLKSKNLRKSVCLHHPHHNILTWMLYTNTPEGRNDGHRQAEDGCGLKGHLVGLMGSEADLLASKLHATKSHVFNKRFQALEGYEVF